MKRNFRLKIASERTASIFDQNTETKLINTIDKDMNADKSKIKMTEDKTILVDSF